MVEHRLAGATGRWASIFVLALAFSAAIPAGARADWPLYGHDLANSRSAGRDGPSIGEVGSLKRAWTFKSATGDFTGTPVVTGGVLVAGDNGGWVYALDAFSGAVIWSRHIGEPITGSAAIDLHARGGALVLVPVARAGGPRLEALSLGDGSVRWSTLLTRQPATTVFGSPVYWRGRVYMGTSGPNGDASSARGAVVGIDEATGRVRWRTYLVPRGHDGGAVWSTAAIDMANGRLYVGTGNAYHDPAASTTDAIVALDSRTGRILGHYQATASDTFSGSGSPAGPDADFGASPNLFRGPSGQALVGEGAKDGTYWALDRKTMRPVWHTSVGPGSAIGGILSSTAYDGSRIFGTDAANGQVWALGRDGSAQWSSADGGTLDFSPVATGNGVLYTATPGGSLVARNVSTGAVLSQFNLGGATFGGMSVVGRAVYAAVGTGPPPAPAPQSDSPGSIVAFGDTSRSGHGLSAFSVRFSTRARGRHAGALLHWFLHRNPDNPTVKPSQLKTEVVDLPPGARFDGRALP
ncbi:MAG: hypothetical protein QOK31_416, partial [Solirubrobacteraceae bacterium]|nr:hypothetical protein [Solirubrobacteraceae bacterium]